MNARDNPFRVERLLTVRYQLEGTTWPTLLSRLDQLNFWGAIVGPHGSGKTTFMEDLAARLPALGVRPHPRRIQPGDREALRALWHDLPSLGRCDALLLDGAGALSPWSWLRLRRAGARLAGLIVTAHRPCILPTLWRCATSPRLLDQIVVQIAGPGALVEPAEALHARHRGNLREALRELYDRASGTLCPWEKAG